MEYLEDFRNQTQNDFFKQKTIFMGHPEFYGQQLLKIAAQNSKKAQNEKEIRFRPLIGSSIP